MSETNQYGETVEQVLEKKRQAHKLAKELAVFGWNNFAQSLVEFYNDRGFLTDKQIEAGRNLISKAKENDWNVSNPPLAVIAFEEPPTQPTQPTQEEDPF